MKIGLVLAGCGFMDGAEVQESVSALVALSRQDVEIQCIAPEGPQHHVVNHQSGEETGETRDILIESARICRGNVMPLHKVQADQLDALVLAGGFGVAKNLCDFAFKGPDCSVNPDIAGLIRSVHGAGKPIGAICIAPALVAKVLGTDHAVELTIGKDAGTAQAIEAMGCKHVVCEVTACHVDEKHKIVSTPAYMLAQHACEAFDGISALCEQVIRLAR